jgi:hypothetical protein
MSGYIDLDALWKVLALGLAFGVGVVALVSVAVVGLDGGGARIGRLRGRTLAAACLLLSAAAVAYGVWTIFTK